MAVDCLAVSFSEQRLINLICWPRQAKMCLWVCAKCTDSDSSHACAKYLPGIYSLLIHSVVFSNFVSGQRKSWSDCAEAQADLGLCCPLMPEDMFSYGAAHVMPAWSKLFLNPKISSKSNPFSDILIDYYFNIWKVAFLSEQVLSF